MARCGADDLDFCQRFWFGCFPLRVALLALRRTKDQERGAEQLGSTAPNDVLILHRLVIHDVSFLSAFLLFRQHLDPLPSKYNDLARHRPNSN